MAGHRASEAPAEPGVAIDAQSRICWGGTFARCLSRCGTTCCTFPPRVRHHEIAEKIDFNHEGREEHEDREESRIVEQLQCGPTDKVESNDLFCDFVALFVS